jgi:hypothetical protein
MQASAIANSVFPIDLREFKLFRTLSHEHTGIWLRDGKYESVCSSTYSKNLPAACGSGPVCTAIQSSKRGLGGTANELV